MRMLCVKNFINGEFVSTDNFIDSFNPATGDVWAQIPDSGREEVGAAVLSAKQAFTGWSHTPVGERSKIVNKIADILESRIDEFAELESHDQGKALSYLHNKTRHRWSHFRSSVMDDAEAVNYTVKQPVGVAGLISPWNLPLYLLTFKIAPAIITGNTIVAKPSEMTSVTAFKLCEVFNAAGLPPGVINVVFGLGSKAGQAIVTHPDVPIVSFTGGTVTAETLRKSAAPFSKKLSLELGGKNPAVIFSDADLDKCVHTTIRSSFLNQGEICLCTSRLYVHQDIYKDFVDRFTLAASELVVGDPQDVNTFTGALISKEHLAKVKGYVEVARSDGATVLCGDGVKELDLPEKCRNGYFMRPTVITNVTDDSRLMTEEIFGPVACIVPFETEEEVVRRANSVKYGLCATLWTQNVSRLHRIAQRLQVGTVWANCWLVRDLNMPFGGTKESGIGREGAKDSIEFFTEEKTICVKM
ncbi:2-aminomuconic semialdehyde dehydrogenase-like isoform X2 [Haliotis rufescens]|uniref:2-aminomuconic semialdehyde dehydrogenase-like isoform X2 n=1 Tax=Haliotis rufescens TaxID=6454 RepID=UPI00201E7B62|nr:2-aminomuconic semialdehyde dehydrogenase-like isoform X2 [Haliotis rufescens]